MGAIGLSGIRKVFPDGTVAVNDVDLEIDDGEFVVFVGPSGCGKTTLLRLISGLETMTAGEIRFDGQVINDVSPRERNMAMVFQNYALYPHMTVRQNIAFALRVRKFRQAEIAERVNEAARILDLDQLLDRKPKQLSGGQRQRVAMGRAIVRHPGAFLLDEPLSNLDAKLRVQLRTELRRLHERLGVTTIHVTHDQVEAMTLGRPRRHILGRLAPAVRHPASALSPTGQHFRGRLHRQPGDELHRSRAHRKRCGGCGVDRRHRNHARTPVARRRSRARRSRALRRSTRAPGMAA